MLQVHVMWVTLCISWSNMFSTRASQMTE